MVLSWWLALLLSCLAACSADEQRDVRETYDYLVMPSGKRYRVIVSGPILRGINTQIGLRISYVAQSRDEAGLEADAAQLVSVLGPELQLAGEDELHVRARLGPPTLALDAGGTYFDVDYHLGDDGFIRVPAVTKKRPKVTRIMPDDPTFPYREAKLKAAAAASAKWLSLLDRGGDLKAIRAPLTPQFRKAAADDGQFRELLAQRANAGLPGVRRELYRMQQRSTKAGREPGDDVLIVYVCESPGRARVLERLVLANDDYDQWQIVSYAFQPIP